MRWRVCSSSGCSAISAIVAAERAMCVPPWGQALASSTSCSRSVTTTKCHGCQFDDDGDRRPASRICSSCSRGIGWSVYRRTLRRARTASHVSMPPSYTLWLVPALRGLVRPGAAGAAVGLVDVDEAGVDLAVAVRGLLDAGVLPGRVEQLGDAVGGAGRVVGVGAPAALAVPELVQAAELGGADLLLGVGAEVVRAGVRVLGGGRRCGLRGLRGLRGGGPLGGDLGDGVRAGLGLRDGGGGLGGDLAA